MDDLMPGPCKLCGDVNYALSFGGPDVCPGCDAGDEWFQAHPDAFKRMLGLRPPPTRNERREPEPARENFTAE